MDVVTDAELGVVRKRAQTAAEGKLLSREATMLRAVAHPGVVQLLDVEGGEPPDGLVLRRVGGGDLATLGDQCAEVVAGLGAALATTVADLHDLGVSHKAIEAAHVLLDENGRPVLCSFGRAERARSAAEAEVQRRDDVRALARLLLECLPAGGPSRAIRTLRLAAGPARNTRCRDARWLARQLVTSVPGACLPDRAGVASDDNPTEGVAGGESTDARRTRNVDRLARRGVRQVAAVTLLLCLLGTGAGVMLSSSSGASSGSQSSPHSPPSLGLAGSSSPVESGSPAPCPAVDQGCGPVPIPGGLLTAPTGRYQLGAPSDVIVVGRWECTSIALPAVLRPSTGQVWTFDAWPTALQPQIGDLAARVPAAWSLRVRPQRSGCDLLEVERRDLPAVTIDPVRT
jgi:serine/threonine protein kinase